MSARVSGKALQERIWLWMRRVGGEIRTRDVMAQFGLGTSAASQTVRRLLRKKAVVRIGHNRLSRYVATDLRPDDLRGLAPGSQQVFADKLQGRPRRWRLAPTRKRNDGSALGRAWKSPP